MTAGSKKKGFCVFLFNFGLYICWINTIVLLRYFRLARLAWSTGILTFENLFSWVREKKTCQREAVC